MICKKYFSLGLVLLFIQACSSTPSIETRHKLIPPKKNEHTGHTPTIGSTHESATTTMPTPVVIAPPPTAVISAAETPQFNLPEENKDKPRSNISYSSNAKKIGVILPITGKNANLGARALNAIRLGLGLDGKDSSFSIAIYDSQSNPDVAVLGVEKLLKEDNVIAILGGLSSKEAQTISSKAEFFQVPFFSFSQKSGLTDDTDYTFRNSVTPEMQVARLVLYSLNTLKAKKFAVLYPNDPYGIEFANKYWDLVLAGGGEVVAAQAYDPKDTDLNIYVQKLVGTYFTDARSEEYKERQKEIALKNKTTEPKKKTRESETQENILQAVVDFDVLFVPDSGKSLGQVMAFMKNNDVAQMTYLGTNLWNSPDLNRRAGMSATNIFFVDAGISPEVQQKSDFHNRYIQAYTEEPSLVEAQVFEAAKILRDVIGSGSFLSRDSLASQLKILGRKTGAYGEIRMNNNHEIERPLNIFGLVDGAIQRAE